MERILFAVALMLFGLPALHWVRAASADQAYPSNTVRLICWSSAGAPLDVMMRQVGKQLGDILRQTFIVENRPGGEGAVAMMASSSQRRGFGNDALAPASVSPAYALGVPPGHTGAVASVGQPIGASDALRAVSIGAPGSQLAAT
jgi:tripartite-type tricarboxylate transporter receptor subunit TctC